MTIRIERCPTCGEQTGMYESGRIESIAANKCRCVPASPPATGKNNDSSAGCAKCGGLAACWCPVPASPRERPHTAEYSERVEAMRDLSPTSPAPVASGTPNGFYVDSDHVPDPGHVVWDAHGVNIVFESVDRGEADAVCAALNRHASKVSPAPAAPGVEALESPQEAEFRAIAIMCCRFDKDYERLMGLHRALIDAAVSKAREEERERMTHFLALWGWTTTTCPEGQVGCFLPPGHSHTSGPAMSAQ